MKIVETQLHEVVILEPTVHGDERGFFVESYNRKTMQQSGINYDFVQDNHSLSVTAGTVRGLHYQEEPMAQTKLVRVIAGAIYDVAVDIRKDSPTFGQWVGVILTAENHRQLLIPRGFAHGFCTLVPNTQVMYKVDQYYSKEHDKGIAWDDPDLHIDWPFREVVLSEKDKTHPILKDS
ncbi:dTDP-4-dehydrorhamnose 3,5-epimerase [Alicyclobacillus ferrooxydans]|uniref:dTDP-4-dehydrorhamnose 3,5-epimerase n=1 Tax=Alicyclobacillus ferrooxydans TaxID=471514 RepID=A0A0P9CZR5_9BACL|nr:dTDP-4-dehydrorhamnose 3,5-epimerase [Alicyclobacillus ferrooxydans]KPV45226.1 dTDP-4-dehydrorhamnose 3,5-epimerase [Alicyclobacillus ferrooxydans]